MFSCSNEETLDDATEVSNEVSESEEISDEAVDTIFHLDPEEQNALDNWRKEGLNGHVKSVSLSSVQIDENGEEFGMGGSYENKTFNAFVNISMISRGGCCGALNEEIEYLYNEDRQLTHRILRESEPWDEIDMDHFAFKEKYFYTAEGELVKKKIAGEDQVLVGEHIYLYNDDHQLFEEEIINIKKDISEFITYEYSQNKKTESHLTQNKVYKEMFFLDENGYVSKQELHLNNDDIQHTKFTYVFDEKGNWIKRESMYRYEYENGDLDDWQNSLREERTLIYF